MKNENLIFLDEKVAEEPIKLPEWSYFTALKEFGKDELLAGAIDILSTTLANLFLPQGLKLFILPLVGPVMEKGVFYVRHLLKARSVYRTTLERLRRPYKYYLRQGLRGGSETLIKDLLIHDPIYIAFMALGVAFTDIPPWMLSMSSYLLAIAVVAGVDTLKNEVLFWRKKRTLQNIGFSYESYWEARFFVRSGYDQERLIQQFCDDFRLSRTPPVEYTDTYFATSLSPYGNRTPKIRYRTRQRRPNESDDALWGPDQERVASFQVVYTKAREQKSKRLDQVRYYPCRKEKLWALAEPLPELPPLETMGENDLRSFLLAATADKRLFSFSFTREACHDNELALCVDSVPFQRPYAIIELKVRDDVALLKKAMRYLITECPVAVLQTTKGKSECVDIR